MGDLLNRLREATAVRNLSLEDRLSARMVISGAISSLLGLVVCIIAHTHIIAVVIAGFMAFSIPVLYAVCIANQKMKTLRIIMLIGVIICIPILWLSGGGLHSGMSIWIVFEILFFALSLSGLIQYLAIVLIAILSVGCLHIERYTPYHYVLQSDRDVIISVFGSILVVGIMVVYMTNYQKALYKKEFATVEEKNEELSIYAEKADRANRAQKIFLANMSHEVRSPMNVVLGFNHLIKESSNVDEIHGFSQNIETAGESLLVIINDILDYSKIEAGKMDLFPAAYRIDELALMCRSGSELLIVQKGLNFECNVDKSIPMHLYGDRVRIRQCVTNLLTNAMKYTESGSVRLSFDNGGISPEGDKVKLIISVTDTGKGINEEQRAELFTRFQRLDENTNRAIEGTGLGLALTKSILDIMGGSIEVSSAESKGSKFTIIIEQEILNSSNAIGNSAVDESNQENSVKSITGMKVLVVDDSNTNLVLMRHFLKQMEVAVVTASSGLETLERVKNEKFDLIFMDHMMPEMDGVETFRRMQSFNHLNEATPVIMLTANAMSGAEEEYRQEGFAGYLSKPVKAEEIKAELQRFAL